MLVRFPVVLVVDDDPHVTRFLEMNLEKDGFELLLAATGQEALEQLQRKIPDVAVVDLLLPDTHGFELARKIKSYLDIPIVMLTAIGTEESIVEGLEHYAEDYIVKPFRYRELHARIQRVLKRTKHLTLERSPLVIDDHLSLDFARHLAILDGRQEALTPTESRLLSCLARNPNRFVHRTTLIDEVWSDEEGDPLRLKVAIHRLREKIEPDPSLPRYLLSRRGEGYKLAVPK